MQNVVVLPFPRYDWSQDKNDVERAAWRRRRGWREPDPDGLNLGRLHVDIANRYSAPLRAARVRAMHALVMEQRAALILAGTAPGTQFEMELYQTPEWVEAVCTAQIIAFPSVA